MQIRALLPLLWLLLVAAGWCQQTPFRFVHWTDIHWGNPHFSPSAWEAAVSASLDSKPQAIVLTGDVVDTRTQTADFESRVEAFVIPLLSRVRGIPLLLCYGNNDTRENYSTDPAHLAEASRCYRRAMGSSYYLDDLGNGVYPQQLGGYTWISLNTQAFSPLDRYPGASAQARRTLDWLRRQLTGQARVVLLLHTPPALDLWVGRTTWRAADRREFLDIVKSYPGPLRILAGHFHRNEIHGIRRPQGDVPVLVAGSLSEKHGYSPNWRSYEWGHDTISYVVHYPGHPDWTRDYRLTSVRAWRAGLQNPQLCSSYLLDLFAHHRDAGRRASPSRDKVMKQFWIE